jgi:hypothetical protein
VSRLPIAITSPVTHAAKQRNSKRSPRSIGILAPPPLPPLCSDMLTFQGISLRSIPDLGPSRILACVVVPTLGRTNLTIAVLPVKLHVRMAVRWTSIFCGKMSRTDSYHRMWASEQRHRHVDCCLEIKTTMKSCLIFFAPRPSTTTSIGPITANLNI